MTAGPDIRIGDAEREATMASLREHYSQGRLTTEDLDERLDAAFAAKTRADLARITADLPLADPYAAPWPPQSAAFPVTSAAPRSGWHQQGSGRRRTTTARSSFLLAGALIFLVLLVTTVAFSPIAFAPRILIVVFGIFTVIRRIFRWIGHR